MPGLFSGLELEDVALRNRIVGARAAGGAGLAVMEQRVPRGRSALESGFDWVIHHAHGFLGASFSPLANTRGDRCGGPLACHGPLENRSRFPVESFDAVRAAWPERLPLAVRIGAVDLHPDSHALKRIRGEVNCGGFGPIARGTEERGTDQRVSRATSAARRSPRRGRAACR